MTLIKSRYRLLIFFFLTLLGINNLSGAETTTFTANLSNTQQFLRPQQVNGPAAGWTAGAVLYNYAQRSFTPATNGNYDIEVISTIGIQDPVMYLYGVFDPATPLANGIIANDDGGAGLFPKLTGIPLIAGTPYTIVTTNFIANDVGTITYTVTGDSIVAVAPDPAISLLPQVSDNPEASLSTGGPGSVAAAAGENVGRAAEATVEVNTGGEGTGELVGETDSTDVTEFRFGLSPQRLKMNIRSLNNGALVKYDKSYGDYGNMLKVLESSLGATKAMANVGNGMSLWASGVYTQGRNKVLFGNPAAADKHYGIMVGTHYYHKPTRQLFGMAFDVGLGASKANIDRKLKSAYRSAEATLYYSYGFTNQWKINVQLAHMLIRANNHRPYGNNNAIAVSAAKSSHTSSLVETDYKFKPTSTIHLRPSVGLRIGHTKQNAYSEKNAGTNNMHFRAATMTEVAFKTGFKISLFHKVNDTTTYGLYPEIGFTRYLRAGRMRQRAGLINSGTVHILESGTPGKNLLNLSLGAGVTDTEKKTKYQVAYTAGFQKYRTSHEVMLKGGWEF